MTDERIDEALRRAALLVGARRWRPTESEPRYWEAVEGWAEAIQALWMEGHSFDPAEVFHADCPSCQAIATFIRTMLGVEKKSRRAQTIEEIATTAFVEDSDDEQH